MLYKILSYLIAMLYKFYLLTKKIIIISQKSRHLVKSFTFFLKENFFVLKMHMVSIPQ